jgi:hypothetical protein
VLPCRAHNKDEYKENPLYAKEAGKAAAKGVSDQMLELQQHAALPRA